MDDTNQPTENIQEIRKSYAIKPKGITYSGRGVYILWSKKTGLFKIGKTNDLRKRMSMFYQTIPEDINLFAFCNNQAITIVESGLHSVFAEKRDKGEWFKLSVNDLAFMFESYGFVLINKSLKEFMAN